MFAQLSDAVVEMLCYIEDGDQQSRSEEELLTKYGYEDGNYRLGILLQADYVCRMSYHPNWYRIAPRGADYLAWDRKRRNDARRKDEKLEQQRKNANRKSNVAISISVAALLVSFLANLGGIIASIQTIAGLVVRLFHR